MPSRLCTLLLLAAFTACGTDSPKDADSPGGGGLPTLPGPPSSGSLGLEAQLDGRYVQSIRIEEGEFVATGAGQEIALTFAAQGMTNVKQFEFRLEIEPSDALAFEGSSFAPIQPFIAPPGFSIEQMEGGLWRTGGASISQAKEGDDTLGTLTLITGKRFTAGTKVQIRIAFFSMGPSFSDRDDYTAADLNMGVVINGLCRSAMDLSTDSRPDSTVLWCVLSSRPCVSAAAALGSTLQKPTRNATHWRVCSSNIVSICSVLPLSVRSKTKSHVQT